MKLIIKGNLGLPYDTSAKAIGMLRSHMQKPEKQYVWVYIYVHPSVPTKLGKVKELLWQLAHEILL